MNYKISEIANQTNLPISTLRYYEDIGLLKPKRDQNNYRIFTESDLNWLEFIQRAKNAGLPMSKIVEYSELRKEGDKTIPERIAILEEQEQLLYEEKTKIQTHIDFLKNKRQTYSEFKKDSTF